MSFNETINEKKKALLAYKEKILEEIQYYDKRIDEFRANHKNNCYYDDADSSDSEDYFPTSIDTGPDVSQLKLQQAMLKTCLQATHELTSLTVLQSEINVLVQDPQLDGESPVNEPGTWKEVTAECRIDLVPFILTFCMHTPNRKFAPTSYRGLKVSLVKKAHEVELNKSVLHTLKRPSDAVEPEGGFILKCANLLEILWRLENKWSPVAPFHHRMKFDLEYMDESYIKIITHAHKQLLDPSIQTDERTLLLSKIINTCLEARGPMDSESDLESRPTDARTETELKNKDSEVMAPPKSLPKKTKKAVTKDNNTVPQKRNAEDENDGGNSKKIKTGDTTKKGEKNNLKNAEKSKETKNNDDSTKDTNTNTGNGEIKKKSDFTKKIKNTDKVPTSNIIINENDNVDVMTNAGNTNENNKPQINKNISKKRKNNDDGLVISKDDNKRMKKMKSNEEIKRKNIETCESNPKRSKSSSDINKPDKESTKECQHIKIVNNNVGSMKDKKNDEIETTPFENVVKTSTPKEKKTKTANGDGIPPKKLDRKTKMSIANDKKFDLITKKISGNEENKVGNRVPKNVEKNQMETVSTKDSIENKITDIIDSNKTVENQKKLNKEKNTEYAAKASVPEETNLNKDRNVIKANNKVDDQRKLNKAKKTSTKPLMTPNTAIIPHPKENIATKDKTLNKNVEIPDTNQADENQNNQNKVKKANLKNVETQKIVNNQKKSSAGTKDTNVNKKTEVELKNKGVENQIKLNKEKNTITVHKSTNAKNNINKPDLPVTAKHKNPGISKDMQTVKTVIEKNANNIKNKDQMKNINKVTEKLSTDKPKTNKVDKIVTRVIDIDKNKFINKNPPKLTTKSVRNINHKSPKNQNLLKAQNTQKAVNTKTSHGNTQAMFSSAEKENGGKVSKIPQKKISLNSEKNLMTNMLRISPRRLPSNFRSLSQDGSSRNFAKSTNIPRFMKKTAPKISK